MRRVWYLERAHTVGVSEFGEMLLEGARSPVGPVAADLALVPIGLLEAGSWLCIVVRTLCQEGIITIASAHGFP